MGFRRLRILDLSPAADQPMTLGPLHLVYNGEIYNFGEIRADLERLGHRFRSSGDSEVVLAAYREWGLAAIPRLQGMFSFAIWDGERRRLVLARDRLGIKPLYYGRHRGRFVFASEPKAVVALAEMSARLNEQALPRFLTFLWVPDPDTLFEGVRKLAPGHLAVVEGDAERLEQYWDAELQPQPGSAKDKVEELREAIERAVARQLVSDVPLGVFLSGGLDSTLIAVLGARASSKPLAALATGFEGRALAGEPGGDDLRFARLVAAAEPSLDYREIVLSDLSADVVGDLVDHFDDPVADPAAISTYLISRAAKPEASVMLSGVGSEELFGGYPRHRAAAIGARLARLPRPVRRAVSRGGGLIPGARPGAGMGAMRHARKFLLGLSDPEPYVAFCAHHTGASLSGLLEREVDWAQVTAVHRSHLARTSGLSPLSRALYLDLKTFLPSLNLAYTDRASMAASVEVRVPLLDEAVVDVALRIPDEMKLDGGLGKAILRQAVADIVPEAVLHRPKTGFGAPVRTWMRDLSSQVVRDCLSPDAVRQRGLFRPEAVARMRDDLVAGRSDEALPLWSLVVFELWARRFLDQPALPSA